MQFDAKIARRLGKLMPTHQMHMSEPVRGLLRVRAERFDDVRRHRLVARFLDPDTKREVLSPLHDAQLLFVDGDTITITGLERIPDDLGTTNMEFAQSWILKSAETVDLAKLQFQLEEAARLRRQAALQAGTISEAPRSDPPNFRPR